MADILQAVESNNFHDVKFAFENKLKRKEKSLFSLFSSGDGDRGLERDVKSAMLAAAKLKDPKILRYMIRNGANVNFVAEVHTTVPPPSVASGPLRTSPLHLAVKAGMYDTVALLLEHNANVNILDNKRRTALHLAASNADVTAVRMLLSRGADVNAVDGNGATAMQVRWR